MLTGLNGLTYTLNSMDWVKMTQRPIETACWAEVRVKGGRSIVS